MKHRSSCAVIGGAGVVAVAVVSGQGSSKGKSPEAGVWLEQRDPGEGWWE